MRDGPMPCHLGFTSWAMTCGAAMLLTRSAVSFPSLHNCCRRSHPLPTVRLKTSTLDWGVGDNVRRLGQSMTRQRKPYSQPWAHAVPRFWNPKHAFLHRVFSLLCLQRRSFVWTPGPCASCFCGTSAYRCRLPLQPAVAAAHSMFSGTTGQHALARGCPAPAPISMSTLIASTTGESRSLPMDSRFGAERSWQSMSLWFPRLTPMERRAATAGTALRAARKDEERSYPELLRSPLCRLVVLALEIAGCRSPEAAHFVRLFARCNVHVVPRALRCCCHCGLHYPLGIRSGLCCCPCFRQQPCRWPPAGNCQHRRARMLSDIPAEACHVARPPISSRFPARSLSASSLLCLAMDLGAMHWDRGTLAAKRCVPKKN